jgi:hypothetical protein
VSMRRERLGGIVALIVSTQAPQNWIKYFCLWRIRRCTPT